MSYGCHAKQCPACGESIPLNQRVCRDCRDEKARRHFAVARLTKYAVRLGIVESPRKFNCTDCGGPADCYDHRDYNKPLEVDPVCNRCNGKRYTGKPRELPLFIDHAAIETVVEKREAIS